MAVWKKSKDDNEAKAEALEIVKQKLALMLESLN